ncbi:MAG TPA: TlpA family protein disulfide reductase [Thermoplasmata archaeon]|nr:TlpA family protein disulfide reductase [Thermoplasmata archaeon]
MNKLLKVLLIITSALVLTLGFVTAGCSAPSSPPTPTQGTKVGNLAPDFQLHNLEGKPVSLSGFRGKPVMLNFWATWCHPCVFEMPYLQQVYEERSARGLVLLPINIDATSPKVSQFLQSHKLSLPVLLDTKKDVAQTYNIQYIPTTFFIDKDGIIQAMKVGAFPNKEAIESDLDKIMP